MSTPAPTEVVPDEIVAVEVRVNVQMSRADHDLIADFADLHRRPAAEIIAAMTAPSVEKSMADLVAYLRQHHAGITRPVRG